MSNCYLLSSLFTVVWESVKNMKILKLWSNELIFHYFSQTMSNCCLLRSSCSLRERENENVQNMVKNSFFTIFHKVCQTATFWGRFLTWEKVLKCEKKKLKINFIWSNELIFHHFSQAMSNCYFLRSLFSLRKGLKIWKHWK